MEKIDYNKFERQEYNNTIKLLKNLSNFGLILTMITAIIVGAAISTLFLLNATFLSIILIFISTIFFIPSIAYSIYAHRLYRKSKNPNNIVMRATVSYIDTENTDYIKNTPGMKICKISIDKEKKNIIFLNTMLSDISIDDKVDVICDKSGNKLFAIPIIDILYEE